MTPLKVTAELAGPLADYAPMLDGLLVELAYHRAGWPREDIPRRPAEERGRPSDRHRPTRCSAAPDPWHCPPVPLAREEIGGWPVFRASAPVYAPPAPHVAYYGKRIGTERAGLLAPAERKVVVTTNTWTKSYRLPVAVLSVPRVVWFARGDAAGVRSLLGDAAQIGRKVAHGWGRVLRWAVDEAADDWSWYAPDEAGRPVLMRPLPLCPELPAGLDGWRPDFGPCCPPYWHRDRYAEVVVPC